MKPFTTTHRCRFSARLFQFHIMYIVIAALFLTAVPYAQTVEGPIYFRKKLAAIKEVMVLPINFDNYFLTRGGIREYNHAMSFQSRPLIMSQVSKILIERTFSVTTLPENSYMVKGWSPLLHFYSVINEEIIKNVYGTSPFPNSVKNFAYSIPPIPDSLIYPTTDAVLFIDGFDDCATRKRLVRKTTAAVVSALSVVTLVVGGAGVFVSVPPDQTIASCALVNRDGKIIWYSRYGSSGEIDMTSEKDVFTFFSKLIGDLSKEVANQ